MQGRAAATLTHTAVPKKIENLWPNANTYLQQGLEVTYQQEAEAAGAKIRLLEVFCSHQHGHSNVF